MDPVVVALLGCPPESGHAVLPVPSVAGHTLQVAVVVAAVAAVDQLLKVAHAWGSPGARWFCLHSVVNIAITVLASPDLLFTIVKPMCSMMAPIHSWWPSHLAFGLHLYHLLAFTKLRGEDLRHHLIFCGVFGAVNFTMAWGPIVNALLFFVTGLPGAIDYMVLAAVKEGMWPSLEEKRMNASINLWLRMPGLVFTAVVMWCCGVQGLTRVGFPAALVCTVLGAGNGIYYMGQVHGNYHRKDAELATQAAAAAALD